MKLFHFIQSQQVKLIRQTENILKELELNLNNLINKENDLINLNNNDNNYK